MPTSLLGVNSAWYTSTAVVLGPLRQQFQCPSQWLLLFHCIEHPRTSHKGRLNSIYFSLHDGKSKSWGQIKNLYLELGERTNEEICTKAQEEADALGVQIAFACSDEESTY
jgi:hypothetical protein